MTKFLLVLGVYSALLAGVGHLVNLHVPEPYMDEIFHIPATQRYCEGNFTYWDPKITTLPGLYLFSVGLLRPLHLVCSVTYLRSVNLLVGLVNLVLIHSLTRARHGHKEGYEELLGLWSSFNISLLPTLFMFNFLYYTDPLSTSLVLLTYCLHLTGRHWLSALAGLLSVLCRQTNIVWVVLSAGETAGWCLVEEVRSQQARTKQPFSLTTQGQIVELCEGVLKLVGQPVRLARLVGLIVVKCGGYILTGLAFLAFVHLNQGIVVGDKSAHVATIHLPQLLYFSAFFVGLTLPYAFQHILGFLTLVKNNPGKIALLSVLLIVVVNMNTMAHPYLLADNRHFTFYIWRRLITGHWLAKYLLVPGYIFCLYHLALCVARADLITKLGLPLCVMISLVPQMLLEFRYFIIPCLLLRSQIRPISRLSLTVETVILVLVNVVTLGLFIYRPFVWDHEPESLQRFMW